MLKIRRGNDRGHFQHGWLDTYHSFSFADYYDPQHMGFRSLRVINEDRIAPAQGFGTHPHNDMEILTYVLSGALEHRDSMGNGAVIRPGELQYMSAGTGITHSEFNHSESEPVHLVQIWIRPDRKNYKPAYAQLMLKDEEKAGRLKLAASRDGRNGSMAVRQDAEIYLTVLKKGESVQHAINPGRGVWVQVLNGATKIAASTEKPVMLNTGDAVAVTDTDILSLTGAEFGEVILFDLS